MVIVEYTNGDLPDKMDNLIIIGVLVFLIWVIFIKPKKNEEEKSRQKCERDLKEDQKRKYTYSSNILNYKNVCWNCGKSIDSKVDMPCNRCHKFYKCKNCKKCLCDNPVYKNKSKDFF